MIEIFVLINIFRRMSRLAVSKGRSSGWGALGVLGWIVGELVGLTIGLVAQLGAAAYVLALACAIVGATIAYFIVKGIRPGGMVAAYAETATTVNANYDPKNPYGPPRVG